MARQVYRLPVLCECFLIRATEDFFEFLSRRALKIHVFNTDAIIVPFVFH